MLNGLLRNRNLRAIGIALIICRAATAGSPTTDSDRIHSRTDERKNASAERFAAGKEPSPPITTADWPTYNHDARGWRYNDAESRLSANNAPSLLEQWRFPAQGSTERIGAIHATPSVVHGDVYFGTATYPAFYKLRPDGTLAWVYRIDTGRATTSLPEGGSNLIDADQGILASALVTNTSVYFGSLGGIFYALDRSSGEEKWKVNTRAEGFPGHHAVNIFASSAILADGKVVAGGGGYEHPYPLDPDYPCCTGRGFVVAFDPDSGEVIWKYEVGEQPEKFEEPVTMRDEKGEHRFQYGPSTSSVWSTPSYDKETGTIFFGTDVNNSPRRPTVQDPRYDTKYSAAVVALDIKTGREKWVTQLNVGDVYNHSLAGYDTKNGVYRDGSVGDTPKIYWIDRKGKAVKVVGVGCKNGGFYVLRARDGKKIENTPIYTGRPQYPLKPEPDPRMIALPSLIGGIQTGCATDGANVFTNGTDWITLSSNSPGPPDGGRVVSLSCDLDAENWRHERTKAGSFLGKSGDPIASGIALANGLACFTTTVSHQLVVLDARTGQTLKQIPIGTVWSGPSISRGRIYVGTGSILFLGKEPTGTLYAFGLPGADDVSQAGADKAASVRSAPR